MSPEIKFKRVRLEKTPMPLGIKIALLAMLGIVFLYSTIAFFNEGSAADGRTIENTGETESTATIRVVIEIIKGEHLDSEKQFVSDITNEIKSFDGIWSPEISDREYVGVTFEQLLTSSHDITIYPRVVSGNPKIEVYEVGGTIKIAEFTSLTSNQYQKVFLTRLSQSHSQDTFDLRVFDGSIQFNHIFDPKTNEEKQ